jgi:solute carrier family 30 (zinc transporter), member 5/7
VASLKEVRLGAGFAISIVMSFFSGDKQLDTLAILAFGAFWLGLHMRTARMVVVHSPGDGPGLPQHGHGAGGPPFVLGAGLRQVALCLKGPVAREVRSIFAHAMARRDSRRMLMFLGVSAVFMVVEAAVGLLTNSLGLMGDAGHMLFDNAALLIGLWASYMSQLGPDPRFSYGYQRFEVVAGFVNSIFLVFVAITILIEALDRFFEPPSVSSDNLLLTSVGGFLVNLGGLMLFHDLAHSGTNNHNHNHAGHQHDHGGSASGAGDGHGPDCYAEVMGPKALARYHRADKDDVPRALVSLFSNVNLQGVFLHLFADTLGSVSVIVSALLIHYYGLHVADPVCSSLVALLIIWSSCPLILRSASILLQRVPGQLEGPLEDCLHEIAGLEGVMRVGEADAWLLPVAVVLSLRVEVAGGVDRQALLRHIERVVQAYLRRDCMELTIQLEGPRFKEAERFEQQGEVVFLG